MTKDTKERLDQLSPAQTRVLAALLLGDDVEEAAARIGISGFTAINHRREIKRIFDDEPIRRTMARFVRVPKRLQLF